MTLGKYINKDTFIHRLDPRNKFILLFVWMIAIFLVSPIKEGQEAIGWTLYLIFAILVMTLYKIAKLKFSMIFNSLKPMWFMMLFLFIINIFVIKTGDLLVSFWKIDIYWGSIIQTLMIVVRLALLIALSTLFTATTKPLDITIAIDDLFAWLKIFKINVHILSMTISIALRFIPTILDETYRIMKAQASRGVDFQNGKFKEKVVAITSLIIPLFISAISRSDELANAMEARNYNPLATRTRYRNLKWHIRDTFSMIFSLVMFAITIFYAGNYFEVFSTINTYYCEFITNVVNSIKGWFKP